MVCLFNGWGRVNCVLSGRAIVAHLAALVVICLALSPVAHAQPIASTWPFTTAAAPTAVAAAPLSGYFAVADSATDTVEVRLVDQSLLATITRAQIAALCTWMSLDASQDGPDALTFSDSGRLLFIAVHDAAAAVDGKPSDAILRYDTQTGELTLFARLEISATDALAKPPGLCFFRGRLYTGTTGSIICFRAAANDKTGAVTLFTSSPASAAGQMVEALTVDRLTNTIYAAWANQVFRSTIGASSFTFTLVGASPARSLAWTDHYGGAANAGLYILDTTVSPASSRIHFLTPAQARGTAAFGATQYYATASFHRGLAASADGHLFVGGTTGASSVGATVISDASDSRLGYAAFLTDEFAQHVRFAKGLISPDGEPPGWVIDADVIPAWSRFHPATPDGAGWAVLVLLMNDYLYGDADAQPLVRSILQRYAGLAPDGIAPSRTADGIFRHWIDPYTGGVKPGWDPEFATLSTMKIVLAASRAQQFYPSDTAIAAAAQAIICGVHNHDAYVNAVDARYYYKGLLGGGADTSSSASPINEGIIFVNQCALFGGATSQSVYTSWLTRLLWPSATYVTTRPVTGDSGGSFQSAFISIYPLLLLPDYRNNASWRTQILNLRLTHMAWTDDNGPVWNTVFSAGTTKGIWGGYHTDAINNSAGNLTTFTALLGLCAGTGAPNTGFSPAAVAAYQAYRVGARETFKSGASLLYRRSSVDPAYLPDSAGLPDVSMGALGLAELLSPGSVANVLAPPYGTCTTLCVVDYNTDGALNPDDLGDFITDYYTAPHVPGPFGYATPCIGLPPPYDTGYRAGFTTDGSRWCNPPNPDNLGDYITQYFAGC